MSLVESVANAVAGLIAAVATQIVAFPLIGVQAAVPRLRASSPGPLDEIASDPAGAFSLRFARLDRSLTPRSTASPACERTRCIRRRSLSRCVEHPAVVIAITRMVLFPGDVPFQRLNVIEA
jgi:hypothetical protein